MPVLSPRKLEDGSCGCAGVESGGSGGDGGRAGAERDETRAVEAEAAIARRAAWASDHDGAARGAAASAAELDAEERAHAARELRPQRCQPT